MPSQWLAMDIQEKAFVVAAIDVKSENDKKEEKKMKNSSGKGKGKKKR
ncbi:MAG: hypothetical protein LUD72_14645 [Bacteroidales bacterium]|nr:hypothetical protein [Bacteroidales bacterium]